METLFQLLIRTVGIVSDLSIPFFAFLADPENLLSAGGGLSLALAAGNATYSSIPDGVLANIRRWHGSIDAKFDNLDNLVNLVTASQTKWNFPQALLDQLTSGRSELAKLIARCRSNYGSTADRAVRNTLLRTIIGLCLNQVKSWAHMQYFAGVLTMDDVHLLGFFLPGETGGRRARQEATDALAEVKVSVINMDFIRVVIDQATTENAALTAHGWPTGVRLAVIVIMAADGKTEVCRQYTSRLHNDIRMPDGSHGKLFIIKAAFLKHVEDVPKFGPEPTFSMPLTTEDLAGTVNRRRQETSDAQPREVEHNRQEAE
ncbi:MAG: hypothetical protein LBP50_06810 [Tannerella sp.]|jgi:hypothetical protein|nr:hypothetical protein [Tannerella sp.]